MKHPIFQLNNCSHSNRLSPISLTINRGETVIISGESGSGKSTLLQIMLGFLAPTDGQIFYNGEAITPSIAQRIRQESSVLFQEPNLTGDTIKEAILLPFTYALRSKKPPTDSRVEQLSKALDISHISQLSSPLNLSGGEKQRFALLRSLLIETDILFLDEPTSALDRESRDSVISLLKEEGKTIIAITHDREWQESAHKKIILKPRRSSGNS